MKLKKNKKKLFYIFLPIIIFVYCSIPKFIITPYLINSFHPNNGIDYKIKGLGGCVTLFEHCTAGKSIEFYNNDSAEVIFKFYNAKLIALGWKKTNETLHETSGGFTYSNIEFKKDIFTQHYIITIAKTEVSDLYPNLINKVNVYIEYPTGPFIW